MSAMTPRSDPDARTGTEGADVGNPYGAQHRRDRAAADAELVANGPRPCDVCDLPVYPDRLAHLNRDAEKFDLDHTNPVALGGGAAKRPRHCCCNRGKGGELGHLLAKLAEGPRTSREW